MNEFEKKIAQLEALAEVTSQLDDQLKWKKESLEREQEEKETYLESTPDAAENNDWRFNNILNDIERLQVKIETLKLAKTALLKVAGI